MYLNKTISILAIISFAFNGLFAREIEETFKKTIPINEQTRLSVENKNGNIDVRSWDNNEIELIAYKRVNAGNKEEAVKLMEELKIVIREHNDEIEVRTEYPRGRNRENSGFFGWLMGRSGNSSYSVSYELRVPKKFDLDLGSTNGRIEVLNCDGRMRLETTNGKIVADDVGGSIRGKTTNGSITASFINVHEEDEMSFISTNGSIKLFLPQEINAEIQARTTNGNVSCDLPMREKYNRSKKKLDAVINDGGMLIYCKTTNGSIRIREI